MCDGEGRKPFGERKGLGFCLTF